MLLKQSNPYHVVDVLSSPTDHRPSPLVNHISCLQVLGRVVALNPMFLSVVHMVLIKSLIVSFVDFTLSFFAH